MLTGFATFLQFLETSGNSADVRERSENLCSQGTLIVTAQQNNLLVPVLSSYFNSFFICDVHGEFGLIIVHLFDILPAILSG